MNKENIRGRAGFRRRRVRRVLLFRNAFWLLFLFGALSLFAGGIALAFIIRTLPDPAAFQSRGISQSTKIYDRTADILLYEIHGEERRTVIPFEEIPESVKRATLAAEDAGFYSHHAFDIRAILRALFHNITRQEGESLQGGSTITQQLVKNAFLRPERTIRRKVTELLLAIRFERQYAKDEIFEFYLNQIPYGSNAYGVEAASQAFFGKRARDLTLAEAAILASLPKSPTYYMNNPDELIRRQQYVLDRMTQERFIAEEEADKAKREKVKFTPFSPRGIVAPHFVIYVKQLLEEKYGRDMVERGGLKVITTLDLDLQREAESIVSQAAHENEERWNASNAALIAEDPKTGEVLAMVGSRDYFAEKYDGNVNVTMRIRQPGSAFKPFVYYAAFQKGYTPNTVIFDVPTEFTHNCSATGEPKIGGAVCYNPQNYDGSWRGPVTFRRALAQSLNIPAVKVLYLAGVENVINIAREFGITTFNEPPGYYGLSLVLGGGGVKLAELSHAYAVLAEDGMTRPQTFVLRVEDAEGRVIEEHEDKPKRVADPQFVRLVNDILSDSPSRQPVFRAGALDIPGYKIAAKTGTSQDYCDAWVFGYTTSLVVGIWTGNRDCTNPIARGGAGMLTAAPIMQRFMNFALPKFADEEFPEPEIPIVAKPMLSGRYVAAGPGGIPEVHTILYYVNKDDPLGPLPKNPASDPQFVNWEISVRAWVGLFMPELLREQPAAEPPPPQPTVVITKPINGEVVTSEELKISAGVENFPGAERVTFYFNGEIIASLEANPDNDYTIFFVPKIWKQQNEIRVSAKHGRSVVSSSVLVSRP